MPKETKKKGHVLEAFRCIHCKKVFNEFRYDVPKSTHSFRTCPMLLERKRLQDAERVNPIHMEQLTGGPIDDAMSDVHDESSYEGGADFDFDIDSNSAIDETQVDGESEKEGTEEEEETEEEGDEEEGDTEESDEDENGILIHKPVTISTDEDQPVVVRVNNKSPSLEMSASAKFQARAKQGGAGRDIINDLSKIVNESLVERGETKLLNSHYISRKEAINSLPVNIDVYKACGDGCRMYMPGETDYQCLSKLPKYPTPEQLDPGMQEVKHLPLLQQLAMLVSEKETLELLQYPYNRHEVPGVISDTFDGILCKKLKSNQRKHNELTLYISIGADGFQPRQLTTHCLTIVNVTILNFPPEKRTEQKYMLQLLLAPGKKGPVDIFSFLKPDLDALKLLETKGMKLAGSDLTIKVICLFTVGDIPASRQLAGQGSHCSACGCKICTISSKGHSYRHLNGAVLRDAKSFKAANISIAQNQPTPFSELKFFHGCYYFPVDLMHVLGSNIGPQMRKLMLTSEFNFDGKNNPLTLDNTTIQKIDQLLNASKNLVPTTFSGHFVDISRVKGKRCVDWIHFLKYTLSTTMLEFFDKETQKALISLSRAINLMCQREIIEDDVDVLKQCIHEWIGWLEKMVDKKEMKPNVFTVNHHFLLHVPFLVLFLGPMIVFAAFGMESTIGRFKPRVKGKTRIGANASNVLVDMATENRAARLRETKDVKKNRVLSENDNGIEVWGPFGDIKLKDATDELKIEGLGSMIQSFYARYYGEDNVPLNNSDPLELGCNLRNAEGDIFGCLYNHIPGNRESFFAKLTLYLNINRQNGNRMNMKFLAYFGSVLVYFRYKPTGGIPRLLAIVRIFDVIKKEGEIWPYKNPSCKGKLIVVHVDSIIDICGRNKTSSGAEYIYYPYQRRHNLPFGNSNLL